MTMTADQQPIVLVAWKDAETSYGWEDDGEADAECPLVLTLGFLVKETETTVVIASTVGQGHNNSRIKIPRGMIQSMKEVDVKPTKKKPPKLPEAS